MHSFCRLAKQRSSMFRNHLEPCKAADHISSFSWPLGWRWDLNHNFPKARVKTALIPFLLHICHWGFVMERGLLCPTVLKFQSTVMAFCQLERTSCCFMSHGKTGRKMNTRETGARAADGGSRSPGSLWNSLRSQ